MPGLSLHNPLVCSQEVTAGHGLTRLLRVSLGEVYLIEPPGALARGVCISCGLATMAARQGDMARLSSMALERRSHEASASNVFFVSFRSGRR